MNLRLLFLSLTLLLTCCFSANAERLTISATTADGALSSPLIAGQRYLFTASGVATNYGGVGYFDAEWQTQPYSSVWEEYDSTWEDLRWDDDHDILDMYIDNAHIQWLGSADGTEWNTHTYSPSHIYHYYIIGSGQSVKFHIADYVPIQPIYAYSDNGGFLTIEITPVPEPSSILALLSGIAGLGIVLKRRS